MTPVPAPEKYPFWSYEDLILFIFLALPCMAVSAEIALLGSDCASASALWYFTNIPCTLPRYA